MNYISCRFSSRLRNLFCNPNALSLSESLAPDFASLFRLLGFGASYDPNLDYHSDNSCRNYCCRNYCQSEALRDKKNYKIETGRLL